MSTRATLGLAVLLVCACSRPDPSSARAASNRPADPAPARSLAAPQSSAAAPATAMADAAAAPDASSSASVTALDAGSNPFAEAETGSVTDAPQLFAKDGRPLPQTDERPSVTSERFQSRMLLLFRAIVEDDPALALPAFFPLVAYQQVKAIAKPERDYEHRLIRAFERDIRAYHRKLGAQPHHARFVTLEVPEEQARFMKPGSEGNKLGYWRVLRSAIRYEDSAGARKELELTSMISWRGEWYVVHLNGFK